MRTLTPVFAQLHRRYMIWFSIELQMFRFLFIWFVSSLSYSCAVGILTLLYTYMNVCVCVLLLLTFWPFKEALLWEHAFIEAVAPIKLGENRMRILLCAAVHKTRRSFFIRCLKFLVVSFVLFFFFLFSGIEHQTPCAIHKRTYTRP